MSGQERALLQELHPAHFSGLLFFFLMMGNVKMDTSEHKRGLYILALEYSSEGCLLADLAGLTIFG